MGRRGPKPDPAAVKKAKGNSTRRPIGEEPASEPASAAPRVAPPAWLKAEGLKVWDRLAPRLIAMKLLHAADAETFARYCRNFARWLKMQNVLDRQGETYWTDSAHGKMRRAHPAFLIGDRLERQLVTAEAVFGLNPAERQRLYAARAALPAGAGDLFGEAAEKHEPATPPGGPPAPASPIGFLQ